MHELELHKGTSRVLFGSESIHESWQPCYLTSRVYSSGMATSL